jgi:predicted transcriptional regulator
MTRKNEQRTVIEQVRDLMPRRALSLTEAYAVAELQATKLLELLDITEPPARFDRLYTLPNLEIQLEAGYKMEHFSGISRFRQGKWLIILDKNDAHGRRRFTLAHEFKHVIDHSLEKLAYAQLGYGDEQRRQQHIEAICQHFAASFLMPKTWVKRWWTQGFQDAYALAGLFQVSLSAMDVQLKKLGFIDPEPDRPVHTYFRRNTMPTLSGAPCPLLSLS